MTRKDSSQTRRKAQHAFLFVTLILCTAVLCLTRPVWGQGPSHDVVSPTGTHAHIMFNSKLQAESKAARTAAGMAGASPLTYHGGPVMRNPTNYLIFWAPPGLYNTATFPAGYQSGNENYFKNAGGTPFYNIVTQYPDNTGVPVPNAMSLGGPSFTDTTFAPPSGFDGTPADPSTCTAPHCPLTDADLQAEVANAISQNPAWTPPGNDVEYFVYTPQGVSECMNATSCFLGPQFAFCAYHSSFGSPSRIYGYLPFVHNSGGCPAASNNFPNGNGDVDVVLDVADHEGIESNTDPFGNAWSNAGGEIGDLCNFNYGFVAPDGTNMVLNGNRFAIQQEFSNDFLVSNPNSDGCTKRYGPDPVVQNPASVAFGEVQAGTSAQQQLQIQNNGGGDLNILDIRLDSSSSPDYSFLNPQPSAATLHAPESLTAQFGFAPPAGASFSTPIGNIIVDTDQTVGSSTTFDNITGTVGVPPTALCAPVIVSTDFNLCSATNASINNGSFDPDGESLTLTQSPAGPYTLGTTQVTLTATDNGPDHESASCSASITVQDRQAPTMSCPAPLAVQCTSSSGAAATINPTFSDNCPGVTASCSPPSGSTFGFGATNYTCTATDGSGNTNSCTSSVTVTDVPPVISSVVASPNTLRPPNKKLDPVSIIVKDSDVCDPSPVCSISSVTASNHLVVAGIDYVITGPLTLELKANGTNGKPFTYIIGVTCADHHGGSTSAQTTVSAP